VAPTPATEPSVPQNQSSLSSQNPALNLFWHYERDLRVGVCRGEIRSAWKLEGDVGYDAISGAYRVFSSSAPGDGSRLTDRSGDAVKILREDPGQGIASLPGGTAGMDGRIATLVSIRTVIKLAEG
jgi:hypothetical protein